MPELPGPGCGNGQSHGGPIQPAPGRRSRIRHRRRLVHPASTAPCTATVYPSPGCGQRRTREPHRGPTRRAAPVGDCAMRSAPAAMLVRRDAIEFRAARGTVSDRRTTAQRRPCRLSRVESLELFRPIAVSPGRPLPDKIGTDRPAVAGRQSGALASDLRRGATRCGGSGHRVGCVSG
jgi:hypothetical protein